MSDRDRMLDLLRERGARGASTLEMRRMGLSGNPSQRRAELIDRGYRIDVKPYKEGRRRGRIYVLTFEPAEVAAVRSSGDPATGVVGSGDLGGSPPGPQEPGEAGLVPPGAPAKAADSEGLFDADAYKPKRQHDTVEAA